MEWRNDEHPPNGVWCWVTDGEGVWIAQRDRHAANGWTNSDTWEDWDGAITHWIPLEQPNPKGVRMGKHEYSQAVRDVVRAIHELGLVDGLDMNGRWHRARRAAIDEDLVVYNTGSPLYTLTDKGRELLREMQGEEKKEAVATMEFDAKAIRQTQFSGGAGKNVGVWAATVIVLPDGVAEGKYHVTLTPIEPEPTPEPPCPVCGKPASEHKSGLFWGYKGHTKERPCSVCDRPASEHEDGLFCCPHCGASRDMLAVLSMPTPLVWCKDCGARTETTPPTTVASAIEAWNRRA